MRGFLKLKPICGYCQHTAELVGGDVIYPHRPDLESKKFWRCVGCDAFVGCHGAGAVINGNTSDGTLPLGKLANPALRAAKSKAHASFDVLWIGESMSRKQAYAWLSKAMGIPSQDCHIGMFSVGQCEEVVKHCDQYLESAFNDS